MPELISQAEYARHRASKGLSGGTKAAVLKAIRTGRITLQEGGIDPESADKEWEASTRKKVDLHINQKPDPIAPEDDASDRPPTVATVTYADVKLRESKAKAEKLEMENALRKGELVDRAGAERAAFQYGRILQKSLVDVLPSKLSMELASMTDPWTIECFIRDQIRQELASIAEMKENDVDSAKS